MVGKIPGVFPGIKAVETNCAIGRCIVHCHAFVKKKPVSLKNILHAAAAAKSLQPCPTLCDPKDGSPPAAWWLPRPWDSPGKNTGVGCHFLLQCMKVKSESEVAQSCLTLRDPMGCSLPGSCVHEIFQARVLEWSATELWGPCKQYLRSMLSSLL